MQTRVKFEREKSEWHAVIPAYPGPKSDLQMMLGADHWLYLMAEGSSTVEVTVDTESFEGSDVLTRKEFGWKGDPQYEGATYWLASYRGLPYGFPIWLCDVTEFIFGELPESIYFKLNRASP